MKPLLKPIWQKYFRLDWRLGLGLILIFGVPRFIIVLQANQNGDYRFTSIIFLVMWIAPYILLTRNGRKQIGIRMPKNIIWILYALFIGGLFCTLVYYIGEWLYQDSLKNWFVYISRSYTLPQNMESVEVGAYFLIFAVIGMTFSPIGEELLYRGLIHESFATRVGDHKASIIDSLAFALTHLAHFGIVYTLKESWSFLLVPAVLWVLLMFLASRLFFICRYKSGSILGAIICHAGFNLAMTYFIFFKILF